MEPSSDPADDDPGRAREEYGTFEHSVVQESHPLSHLDPHLERLDTLYRVHAERTRNTATVQCDQEGFKILGRRVLEEMRARSRGVNSDPPDVKVLEGLSQLGGDNWLGWLGANLMRGSQAVPGSGSLLLPCDLGQAVVDLREQQPTQSRRERTVQPSAAMAARPEASEGLEQTADQRQQRLQQRVLDAVDQYYSKNTKALLLDRLCFDAKLAFCIENYFLVCTLVKEGRLRVRECEGLPVVFPVHEELNESSNVDSSATELEGRRQISISLDQKTHETLRRLFRLPMVVRGDE